MQIAMCTCMQHLATSPGVPVLRNQRSTLVTTHSRTMESARELAHSAGEDCAAASPGPHPAFPAAINNSTTDDAQEECGHCSFSGWLVRRHIPGRLACRPCLRVGPPRSRAHAGANSVLFQIRNNCKTKVCYVIKQTRVPLLGAITGLVKFSEICGAPRPSIPGGCAQSVRSCNVYHQIQLWRPSVAPIVRMHRSHLFARTARSHVSERSPESARRRGLP